MMTDKKEYNYQYFKNTFQKIKEEFSEKKGIEVRFNQLCHLFSQVMDKIRERMDKVSDSIEKFTQEIRENTNPMYQTLKDINVEIAKTVAAMVDSPNYSIEQSMAAIEKVEKNIMNWDNYGQRRELAADFISTFSQHTKSLEGYLLAEDLIHKFREMEKEMASQKTPEQKENTQTKETDKSIKNIKFSPVRENPRSSGKTVISKTADAEKHKASSKAEKTHISKVNTPSNKKPIKSHKAADKPFQQPKTHTSMTPKQEEAVELPFEDYENNPIEQHLESLYTVNEKEKSVIQSEVSEEPVSLPFEEYPDQTISVHRMDEINKTAVSLADGFDSGPDGGIAFLEWSQGKSKEEIQEMATLVDEKIQSPAGAKDLFDAITDGKLDVHIKSEFDFEFER